MKLLKSGYTIPLELSKHHVTLFKSYDRTILATFAMGFLNLEFLSDSQRKVCMRPCREYDLEKNPTKL